MATLPLQSVDPDHRRGEEPRAVLCGSFRRDPDGLRTTFNALQAAGCRILSPASIDFVDEVDGFVITAAESEDSPSVIEARHIAAVRGADFVWLHAPRGYVGPSAALEIGIALSLDVPIFSDVRPTDITVGEFVTVVASPTEAASISKANGARTPASPLRDLQTYYGRVAAHRGFSKESPQDTMLLLTEEVGELARAIRKMIGLSRAASDGLDAGSELADVQLYVLHLANVIGVDLAEAVVAKERVNHARYAPAA